MREVAIIGAGMTPCRFRWGGFERPLGAHASESYPEVIQAYMDEHPGDLHPRARAEIVELLCQQAQDNPYAQRLGEKVTAEQDGFRHVGRNIFVGPKQTKVDFSVIKFVPVTEAQKLMFRTEFINLFNTPNFANPVNVISSANFGQVVKTSTGPRVMQFALKYNF